MTITDSLLDLAEHQARMVLITLKQNLMPSWVMFTKDRKAEIIATPWRNDHEKHLCERSLRDHVRKKQVVAYSFLSEAWLATVPTADWSPDKPLPEAERPMQRADRKEIVMAFASDGTTKEWRVWEIIRDWHEQVITLDPRPFPAEATPAGWVTKLL